MGALTAVVAAMMSVPSVEVARANWFGESNQAGECRGGIITDNKDIYFSYVDTTSELTSASSWVQTNLLNDSATNPTTLDTFYTVSPTNATDVLVLDRYYTDYCEWAFDGAQWTTDGVSGVRGITTCNRANASRRCDQQVVRISNRFLDAHGTPGSRWIACHEIGHAVGLRHRSQEAGCMFNEADTSTRVYTTHDPAHFRSNWSAEPASGSQ
jgi:hypothetical protein